MPAQPTHAASSTPAPLTTRPHPGLRDASADQLRSLQYCRQLTRQHAGSFYFGLRLTPEPKRSAMFGLYALLRRCDDLADNACPADTSATVERIARFRQIIADLFANRPLPPDADDPIFPAVAYLLRRYPIREHLIHAMLDGQQRDAANQRYESFDDLRQYCYEVASTVGLLCLAIWGYDDQPQTLQLAEDRGIALQLTNILRDLREDALARRLYLPRHDMQRFDLDEADLRAARPSPAFDALMQHQIARARDYYTRSADLERHIAPDCRPTSWALMTTYRQLLERIAHNPRQVLTHRVRLGPLAKTTIATRALTRALTT